MKYLSLILMFQLSLQGFSQNDSLSNTISETAIYDFVNYYLNESGYDKCPCLTATRHFYGDTILIDSTNNISKHVWPWEYVSNDSILIIDDTLHQFIDSNDHDMFLNQILNPPFIQWDLSKLNCRSLKKKKRRDRDWWCTPKLSIPIFSRDLTTVYIYTGFPTRWSIWHLNPINNSWERITGHQDGS